MQRNGSMLVVFCIDSYQCIGAKFRHWIMLRIIIQGMKLLVAAPPESPQCIVSLTPLEFFPEK